MSELLEFYPTPENLIERIFDDFSIKTYQYKTFLEPSAGSGNLTDFIRKKHDKPDIDCIEKSGELRSILIGKGERVVYDDFLGYQTCKHYDLILMNPPFSNGDAHLLKALSMVKDGGDVLCILNAETLKNPCTNRRKDLLRRLEDLDADIRYYEKAFASAEKKTDVEIAVVYVSIPTKKVESVFLSEMKTKYYDEPTEAACREVAFTDSIKNAIIRYNMDVEAGIKLIREYYGMKHLLDQSFSENSYYQMIEMTLHGSKELTVNEYIRMVRKKYWEALFENPEFTKQMTGNLKQEYRAKVEELADYDFNEYNIRELRISMTKNLIRGIEDCIVDLFEEMTVAHSWYAECSRNIHYYNGWATNKAWIINRKVILPYDAYHYCSSIFEDFCNFKFRDKLADIEKCLGYLDTKGTDFPPVSEVLKKMKESKETRDIETRYFTFTVYKKGTCHITFKDEDLLKKLNIFGCRHKGWLPPAYGKKSYSDMSEEERQVIDSFEGRMSYEHTMQRKEYFLSGAESALKIEKAG